MYVKWQWNRWQGCHRRKTTTMTSTMMKVVKLAMKMTITAVAAAVADRQLVHQGIAFWRYNRE